MSSSEAEFDRLASDLYKTLGISGHERISSAARSGSWKRKEDRSSSMKVKQDWASEPRSSHLKRVSSELASPPAVSSPPTDSEAYTFTKPRLPSESKPDESKPKSPRSSPKAAIGNCEACGRRIGPMEEACTALEKIYHVTCFTCAECKRTLLGKTFYQVQGRVLCQKDYEATLQVCHVCERPVMDRVLKAIGKVFHPGCFACATCGKCLEGVHFTVDASGRVYCIEDFHKRYAPKCGVCNQPIRPEQGTSETIRIISMDKSFHPECYKCEDCGVSLAKKADGDGNKCYPLDDHLLCRGCNTARIRSLTKATSIDFDFSLRSRTTVT